METRTIKAPQSKLNTPNLFETPSNGNTKNPFASVFKSIPQTTAAPSSMSFTSAFTSTPATNAAPSDNKNIFSFGQAATTNNTAAAAIAPSTDLSQSPGKNLFSFGATTATPAPSSNPFGFKIPAAPSTSASVQPMPKSLDTPEASKTEASKPAESFKAFSFTVGTTSSTAPQETPMERDNKPLSVTFGSAAPAIPSFGSGFAFGKTPTAVTSQTVEEKSPVLTTKPFSFTFGQNASGSIENKSVNVPSFGAVPITETKGDKNPEKFPEYCDEIASLNYSLYNYIKKKFDKAFSGIHAESSVTDPVCLADLTKPLDEYKKHREELKKKYPDCSAYLEKQEKKDGPVSKSTEVKMPSFSFGTTAPASTSATFNFNPAATPFQISASSSAPVQEKPTGNDGDEDEDEPPVIDEAAAEKFKSGEGEEHETTLVEVRMKILKTRKEGGSSDLGFNFIKINQDKNEPSKVRILARQEGKGLITINSIIGSSVIVTLTENKKIYNVFIVVPEIQEGQPCLQKYIARTKNADDANKLVDTISKFQSK